MLHDLFTIEIIGKTQGGLNNFEHNCIFIGLLRFIIIKGNTSHHSDKKMHATFQLYALGSDL